MRLVLGTLLFAVASALFPVLNLEAYLAVVAVQAQHLSSWQLGLVGGAGQMVGKAVWFYAGIQSMRLPWLRRKMERPAWQQSYQRWHDRIHGRPLMAGLVTFASAFSGFPPFAVIAVLAGSLRMSFWVFMVTGLTGRWLRFWGVLAGVGFLVGS